MVRHEEQAGVGDGVILAEDDQRKAELLACFRMGYKHGAASSAMAIRFTEHARADIASAYTRGYQRGRDDATLAAASEAERLGYDARMSILRGAPRDVTTT